MTGGNVTGPDGEATPLTQVGDRYMLVELLESDDRREIWRGHDDLASRQVVVTRYLAASDEWRTSFERRARQLEALRDPGVASALAHDSTSDPPWLATAYVDGETAAQIAADPGLSADDSLAVIGQAALALAAAHGVGVGHGRVDGEHIQVRPDGSIALIGFVLDRAPSPADDLRALGRLAHELLDDSDADSSTIADFLRLLDSGDWDDPTDIGRTALALAAAHRVDDEPPLPSRTRGDDEASAEDPNRPWYTDEERKRVRNRLIALAAIVVLGGGALLRIFTAGAGHTSVPNVIGEPWPQAQHDLNEVGLRGNETLTTGPAGTEGTVIAQDPPAGQRAKVGAVVQLTVATSGR